MLSTDVCFRASLQADTSVDIPPTNTSLGTNLCQDPWASSAHTAPATAPPTTASVDSWANWLPTPPNGSDSAAMEQLAPSAGSSCIAFPAMPPGTWLAAEPSHIITSVPVAHRVNLSAFASDSLITQTPLVESSSGPYGDSPRDFNWSSLASTGSEPCESEPTGPEVSTQVGLQQPAPSALVQPQSQSSVPADLLSEPRAASQQL